jgi:hypothetical protein
MTPRRRRLPVIAFTLFCALGSAPLVLAQPQPPPDLVTQAKAHYELGMTAYELGHYDRAIDAFSKAYELDPAPVLLYNIAQAHWKKNNPEQAISFYRRYLEADPQAQNRARIKTRIHELETQLKQNPRPMPAIEPASTPSAAVATAGIPGGAAPTSTPSTPARSADPTPPPAPAPAPAPSTTPPPARTGALAANETHTAPSGGGGPYWQPPDTSGLPSAGRPAPLQTSALMPPPPTDSLSDSAPPVYRRPWFWGGVGAAVLLTAATVFLLRSDHRGWSCGPDCPLGTKVVPN